MNTELLTTIKRIALDDPDHFDMEMFADDCGTTCCIAGFGVKIANPERFTELKRMQPPPGSSTNQWLEDRKRWEAAGAEAIGISKEQAERLFYYESWPLEFELRYNEAIDPDSGDGSLKAATVADRIDHFIATEGRE